MEGVRTGLAIGGAVTAGFALLLAFRRQQLAERTQQATEYDAGEKRVTELYVKAVDQLGSDKAPVRLGGLYALERLAQDNPVHRQSIVEVFCAYLRMPYTPPGAQLASGAASPAEAAAVPHPANPPDSGDPDKPARDPREERQVRLTAQRILARHLRPQIQNKTPNHPAYWGPEITLDPTAYWGPEITLDLTEAVLTDADFADCHLHNAIFTKANFTGHARFDGATFAGRAVFDEATFTGNAVFGGATFNDVAGYVGATFTGNAVFGEATFTGWAVFDRATFNGNAVFGGATFTGWAVFDRATFNDVALFDGAAFNDVTLFNGATFNGNANFERATLGGASYDGPSLPD